MNLKRLFMTFSFLIVGAIYCHAQTSVIVQKGVNLLPDTAASRILVNSLNAFLDQASAPAAQNTYALKATLPETAALLAEMKTATQNATLKNNNYYKPYLTNVTPLSNGDVLLQLSYMAGNESMPHLHGMYQLVAKMQEGCFYFSSPLQRQTTGWKTQKMGYITCHYKTVLNLADVKAYQQTLDFYNAKLKSTQNPIELYYCNDFPEVLQILGIEYKAEYAGIKSDVLSATQNGINLMVNGWYDTPHRFDPHDLFHDRLRTVMDPNIINRPVDEGCAYLYGGSWGYTWAEIKTRFKKYLEANPQPDWLPLYTSVANFEAGQKPLKVGYLLNALIAQKLEKLTGINKANFNVQMDKLVKAEF